MKQREMSKYLKIITVVVAILFLVFVAWFMPAVIKDMALEYFGETGIWITWIVMWLTAIPCFLSLWKFWGICVRIGNDQSFSIANAKALKSMSHFMLVDMFMYIGIILTVCIGKWYKPFGINVLFGMVMILAICLVLAVL